MPFRALVPSPLGPVLLESDEAGLTGLYFTDQRDLPRVPGMAAGDGPVVSDPTAGMQGGRALRTFKVVRKPAAAIDDLSADVSAPSASATGRQRGADAAASMRLLQADTPAHALGVLQQTHRELDEYWRGTRRVFDMPLAPRGTAFQHKVWRALLDVAWGDTLSYGELALAAGMGAGHGRAVGTAVGSNPVSIIIPCHRILARNGTLNGYGGGLERKVRLLQIEGFVPVQGR